MEFENFIDLREKRKERSMSDMEIQDRKDKRKRMELREELLRQDRKDRRAYLEFIASANQEINKIYEILAIRKNVGNIMTGDRMKDQLNKRLDNACYRIDQFWDEINTLNKKIETAEKELMD